MFISALDLFKVGIGPSSSHTVGPMVAATQFMAAVHAFLDTEAQYKNLRLRCTLRGSLAWTGHGHATDTAITLGVHGYSPQSIAKEDVAGLQDELSTRGAVTSNTKFQILFDPDQDIIFDRGPPLAAHPNGMIFQLLDEDSVLIEQTRYSIGGGFVCAPEELQQLKAPIQLKANTACDYPFDSATAMLEMSNRSGLSIAQMKRRNELAFISETQLNQGLDGIWAAMKLCIENGLKNTGILPGGLKVHRRARHLYQQLCAAPQEVNVNDWLCAWAMAVNEENAAGHMVVTAPTNGAAGVIPAVLNHLVEHLDGDEEQIRDFLLVASAIGGLIKHRSSISGAEVGCQGEVGSAAAMAAAGLAAVRGGTSEQVENAAEIALEHHLGMTCDPVKGLVQVPCIERNGFGAIKAIAAASLALRGTGAHFMPLDNCIEAMKQTGLEMSEKYKETSRGGLAVSLTEC